MRYILSALRRAITDYKMIKDGDGICVGLSGGKDSLVLLSALSAYRRFSPEKFKLIAVTVDMGFKDADFSGLSSYCESLSVPHYIEKTDLAEIIFDIRKEKNPCSLCAKMRRGALNNAALSHGCKKLALGHHADDAVETFFMCLFSESRISCFQPVSYMDKSGITLIRPLIYLYEREITGAAKNLPAAVVHNPCPVNHHTRREYMKELMKGLEKDMPGVKERVFNAINHPERAGLWPEKEGNKN